MRPRYLFLTLLAFLPVTSTLAITDLPTNDLIPHKPVHIDINAKSSPFPILARAGGGAAAGGADGVAGGGDTAGDDGDSEESPLAGSPGSTVSGSDNGEGDPPNSTNGTVGMHVPSSGTSKAMDVAAWTVLIVVVIILVWWCRL